MKFDVSSSLPFPAFPLPLQPFPPPLLLPLLLHRHSFTPGPSSSGPPRQSSLAYAHRATHSRFCSLSRFRWCPGRPFPPPV